MPEVRGQDFGAGDMRRCPDCGDKVRVVNSRDKIPDEDRPAYDFVYRRYECRRCGVRFNTKERHDPEPPNHNILCRKAS